MIDKTTERLIVGMALTFLKSRSKRKWRLCSRFNHEATASKTLRVTLGAASVVVYAVNHACLEKRLKGCRQFL